MTVPNVFISYSHKDEIWKDRLLPHLGMLAKAGRLTIWEDRAIDTGATWYDEIKKAMEDAEVAVCLISADYLNSDFCVKEEIPYLLERRKSDGMVLIPILIRPCAWKAIEWLKAIQMLPRDGKSIAKDFKDDWDTPFTQVAEQILLIPEKKVLLREVYIEPRWSPPEKVDVDRLPVTGKELFGRQTELKLLDEAWESDRVNVISFVAWGGVGKSTLINKWCKQMAVDDYRGARRVFAWSFYSQGTAERVTSADIFIAEALKWFGDPEMANSSASPWDKGQRLADLVRSEKTLLLLDGMEPLQSYLEFERGKIKDPALAVLVTELARENPGLCAITTRESVIDLTDFSETIQQIDLEQISAEAGRALLRVGGVQGTDAELEQAARDFGLHALALNLLAAYIHEIPGRHISNASAIPNLDVSVEQDKHPRRLMTAFTERFGDSAEIDLLRILGLFSSPVEEEIRVIRAAPPIPNLTEHIYAISETEWLQLINRLRRVKLIAPESKYRVDTVDTHPLVREHFGKQLKQEYPNSWREGNNRLYEYYKSITKEYPDTIEELAPLFETVLHGCQAGRHEEVLREIYWRRIQRREEFFASKKLGANGSLLAILSAFFDQPWRHPVATLSYISKSNVLGEASHYLSGLSRLTEAIESRQAVLEIDVAEKAWKFASNDTHTLSELYLTIGALQQAREYAQQSVELADRGEDIVERVLSRTTLANALHQEGRHKEAENIFREAEQIQREGNPGFLYLYSLRGFQYCDILLSQGQVQEVQRRATESLKLSNERWYSIFSVALDNLALGRVHLFLSQREPDQSFVESLNFLTRAVDGLRKAERQDYIPLALLARVECYRAMGALDKALKDLDEAFTIATRGEMGLHLADCHLEYARLYLVKGEKIIAREHWQIAKDSIDQMGYHRRDKEVQELEVQLK